MNHDKRKYRFSSSQIYRLVPKGKVLMTPDELLRHKRENPKSRSKYMEGGFSADGKTYIDEKIIENKLGRSLSGNVYSRPIAWGHIMEYVCHRKLGQGYQLVSQGTLEHHEEEFKGIWCGTPDYNIVETAIAEQKSYQLKKFAQYSDCLMEQDIDMLRENFPAEYWQIVSNCEITNLEIGEAISFMPYRETLEELREEIMTTDVLNEWGFDHEAWKYRFLTEENLHDLPYIDNDGYFEEITKFRFVVPEEDRQYLRERVKEANQLLNY